MKIFIGAAVKFVMLLVVAAITMAIWNLFLTELPPISYTTAFGAHLLYNHVAENKMKININTGDEPEVDWKQLLFLQIALFLINSFIICAIGLTFYVLKGML